MAGGAGSPAGMAGPGGGPQAVRGKGCLLGRGGWGSLPGPPARGGGGGVGGCGPRGRVSARPEAGRAVARARRRPRVCLGRAA